MNTRGRKVLDVDSPPGAKYLAAELRIRRCLYFIFRTFQLRIEHRF